MAVYAPAKVQRRDGDPVAAACPTAACLVLRGGSCPAPVPQAGAIDGVFCLSTLRVRVQSLPDCETGCAIGWGPAQLLVYTVALACSMPGLCLEPAPSRFWGKEG